MKNSSKNDIQLTRAVLATARRLAEDEEVEVDDPKMNEKIRNLKPGLTKLTMKGRKTLKQMGIDKNIMVSQTTVEDLVDMLSAMTNKGG